MSLTTETIVEHQPMVALKACSHHPDDATLMSFAAGSLPSALAAVVATHLVACKHCRKSVRDMEDIGSLMLGDLDAAADCAVTKPDVPRDEAAAEQHSPLSFASTDGGAGTTAPLTREDAIRNLTGYDLADIPWKRLGFGAWHYPIATSGSRSGDLRLIKVQRGQSMPEHGHGGSELTLVLDGAYHDELGTFATGDVADLDDSIEHRPVADAESGCICLIASERKARFT
ncbi:MAG: ChrR family anti-sigma-E factor, partial [Pseudomonadota bacterium]